MVVFSFGPSQLYLFFRFAILFFTGFCSCRVAEPLVERLSGIGASANPDEAGIKDDATYVPEYELRP